jgi:hypothetical protein
MNTEAGDQPSLPSHISNDQLTIQESDQPSETQMDQNNPESQSETVSVVESLVNRTNEPKSTSKTSIWKTKVWPFICKHWFLEV